jgi:DNA-binding protein H-NS
MKFNLKDLNKKELEQLKTRVEKALGKISISEMKAARVAAEKAAKSYGFSLDELVGGETATPAPQRQKKKAPKASAPKYANPADSSQTWTGKGRRPNWVLEAQKAGKTLDDLAI